MKCILSILAGQPVSFCGEHMVETVKLMDMLMVVVVVVMVVVLVVVMAMVTMMIVVIIVA